MRRRGGIFTGRLEPGDCYPGLCDLCTVLSNVHPQSGCGFPVACNPFFFPGVPLLVPSFIVFSRAEATCANAAYTTIIAHEYGHFVSAGLRAVIGPLQPIHLAWFEGYSDSVAHLLVDTPNIGEDFKEGCGYVLRNPLAPPGPWHYPVCSADGYERGMVLSGSWLDILGNMRATYGAAPGLELTRQLHVDWSTLMMGGQFYQCPQPPPLPPVQRGQSAHSLTLVEVLVADDDDGDLSNGTPHATQICAGFAQHSIFYPGEPSPCGESAGVTSGPPAVVRDCDRDGAIGLGDFACFLQAYATGSRWADCNRDGQLTVRDIECFQQAITVGQP